MQEAMGDLPPLSSNSVVSYFLHACRMHLRGSPMDEKIMEVIPCLQNAFLFAAQGSQTAGRRKATGRAHVHMD
jgi:hypothetical protein